MSEDEELNVVDVILREKNGEAVIPHRIVLDRSKGNVIVTTEGHIYQIINGRMARLYP